MNPLKPGKRDVLQEPPHGTILRMHKDGMDYTVLRPAYPIDVFVDHFMVAKGYPSFQEERLFPSNEVELFFNLGDPNRGQLLAEQPNFTFSTAILSGLRSSFMRIFPGRFFYIAGIRFNLFGFYHLFQLPATEIQDENLPAEAVLGADIPALRQRLGEEQQDLAIIALLNNWMRQRMEQHFYAARSWQKIDHSLRNPRFLIKESLPDILGYSHKHSVHLITRMCGLSPKLVNRIYRLKSVMNHPGCLAENSWSGITYDFGFSDQSHLIREFKQFTGFTPTEFVQSRPKDFELKQLR